MSKCNYNFKTTSLARQLFAYGCQYTEVYYKLILYILLAFGPLLFNKLIDYYSDLKWNKQNDSSIA